MTMINKRSISLPEKRIVFQKLHFDSIRRKRALACLIDSSIILCFSVFIISLQVYKTNNDINFLKSLFDLFCVGWIGYYGISLMNYQGSTFGMRLLRIKVVGNNGKKYHLVQALALPFVTIGILLPISWLFVSIQNGLNLNDLKLLIYLIPHFLILNDLRRRALQDIIARVVFIRSDYKYSGG